MTTNQDQTIYVTENKQEFVPSVGDICLAQVYPKSEPEWHECEVLKVNHNDLTAVLVGDTLYWSKNLRPLKTEAEINAEKQVKEIWNDLEEFYVESDCPQPYDTAKHMHSKGYIKPREISGDDIKSLCDSAGIDVTPRLLRFALLLEQFIKGEA